MKRNYYVVAATILIVCIIIRMPAQAQLTISPAISLSATNQIVKTNATKFESRLTGSNINFGLGWTWSFTKKISIGGQIMYVNQQSDVIMQGSKDIFTKIKYVQMPVWFMYKLHLNSSQSKFVNLGIGPYWGIATKAQSDTNGIIKTLNIGSRPSDVIKKFDFGISLMASLKAGNFSTISFYYNHGFTNVANSSPSGLNLKNYSFGVIWNIDLLSIGDFSKLK